MVCAQTRLASQWLLFDSLMPSSDTGACGRALTVVTTAQQPGSGQLPAVSVGADFFSPPLSFTGDIVGGNNSTEHI